MGRYSTIPRSRFPDGGNRRYGPPFDCVIFSEFRVVQMVRVDTPDLAGVSIGTAGGQQGQKKAMRIERPGVPA
jgi:hypothetical protein